MRTKKSQFCSSEKGSALVLTVIVLVNALLIVAAISVISIMERKASIRTKNSTPAFQAADSGIEWVLYQVSAQSDPITVTLEDVFGTGMSVEGIYDCPTTVAFTNVDCEFYFIDSMGEVITDDLSPLIDIDSVRSVGKFGDIQEEASRAIEAEMQIMQCPPDFVQIADFCVAQDVLPTGTGPWFEAAHECADVDYGGRLCTAAEWYTACQLSSTGAPYNTITGMDSGGAEWVDDFVNNGNAISLGSGNCNSEGNSDPSTGDHQKRCCSNIFQ